MIQQLIDSAVLIESVKATSKEEALAELLAGLCTAKLLDTAHTDEILQRLRAREELGSTGIGNGVAVPHVKTTVVDRISLVLARSEAGIDWQAIDGKPVRTLFLILAPEDRADEHLKALRWVSTLARNADFRRFAIQADSERELRDLLREMSEPE